MRFYSYRLSPEYPSPVPLLDCERATRYFFAHAHMFGVDRSKIGVIGRYISSLVRRLGDNPAKFRQFCWVRGTIIKHYLNNMILNNMPSP